jgi:isopentenyl diphosphate isomerase/L-lactate dehydrogenase-like FMN-dependent dehydrogenase
LSNYGFYKGVGTELGLSDPVFLKRLTKVGIDPKKDLKAAGRHWIDQVWHGKAFSWKDIAPIMAQWKRISGGKPFMLKGIQSTSDAKLAVELGCDGIVVR